jgi:lysozyme family protein
MTATNFTKTTSWLLIHEGGYVDHPEDPGGATNRGVTQAVYDGYRIRKGKQVRSVRYIDDAEVYDIYRTQYWDKVWGDELPNGLDYAVFDFAVNSGPSRAIKFLQRVIGVPDDGIMGNVTMGKIRERQARWARSSSDSAPTGGTG